MPLLERLASMPKKLHRLQRVVLHWHTTLQIEQQLGRRPMQTLLQRMPRRQPKLMLLMQGKRLKTLLLGLRSKLKRPVRRQIAELPKLH